jgi:hypothetical protein
MRPVAQYPFTPHVTDRTGTVAAKSDRAIAWKKGGPSRRVSPSVSPQGEGGKRRAASFLSISIGKDDATGGAAAHLLTHFLVNKALRWRIGFGILCAAKSLLFQWALSPTVPRLCLKAPHLVD